MGSEKDANITKLFSLPTEAVSVLLYHEDILQYFFLLFLFFFFLKCTRCLFLAEVVSQVISVNTDTVHIKRCAIYRTKKPAMSRIVGKTNYEIQRQAPSKHP